MAQAQKRVAPRQRTTLSQITKSLDSFSQIDTPADGFRQVPIGAIRLAARFGLSVTTAVAVATANG